MTTGSDNHTRDKQPKAEPVRSIGTETSAPAKPSAARTKSSNKLTKAATEVVRRLTDAGFEAFFAGGSVRDMLMGRTPDDIDIATSARPDQVMEIFRKTVAVGAAFGVVVVLHRRFEFQVATFRSDGAYLDGRHPDSVHFSTAREDVKRRDFTINGMLMDPLSGTVFDFVGGKEDIRRRLVRTIGAAERRFLEDRLRMLRAVRFALVLDFKLEAGLGRAIGKHAQEISLLSPERIVEELKVILTHPARGRGIRMMHDFGLLGAIFPEVAACEGVEQEKDFHPEGDVLEHTFRTLENLRKPDFPLALAALLHDVAKPATRVAGDRIRFYGHDRRGAAMAAKICRRLRLSRLDRETVVDLVGRHMHFFNLQKMRESRLRRFLESPVAAAHIELHRADCLASHGKLDNLSFIAAMRRRWSRLPKAAEPLIRGRDLIALGYLEGPVIGRILREVRDLQLEGKIGSAEEARSYVLSRHPPHLPFKRGGENGRGGGK